MKPVGRVLGVSFVVLLLLVLRRDAEALDLQPWAQWGGSTSTQNLVIVPGAADFNNDGRLDVMAYKPSTRKFWIGRNVAGFGFSFCATLGSACIATESEAWATLPTPCNAGYQFYSGQFGGSTLPDVAVYNPCVGDVRVLINYNGISGGLTGPMATVSPISGWKMIAGDFAGDAKTDVMVYYEGDGSIFVGTNVIFAFNWTQWGSVEADPIGSGVPPWQFYPAELTNEGKMDIIGYRPGTPKPSSALNTRVGRNMGASFSFVSVLDLQATNMTPIVGHFSGRVVADLALRQDSLPAGIADLTFLKNSELSFVAEPGLLDLEPNNTLWTIMAGDFVASGASTLLADVFAYYPGDGSFWVAENRGYPPEGYAWPPSVAPGETLGLYTSGTLSPTSSNVTFHRVTSNNAGVLSTEASPTAALTVPSAYQVNVGSTLWQTGPQWTQNISFTIPSGWPSGFYVATLKPNSGPDYRITFIVKPTPATRHRTALIANVNTWNAYNDWGGGSHYTGKSTLSLLRPNPSSALQVGTQPGSISFPQTHLAHAEVWLHSTIESKLQRGMVDVYSDLDFHNGLVVAGSGSEQYSRLILSTHPEYWTDTMRGKLKAFLDAGGTLLYLGGNGIFERGEYQGANNQTLKLTGGNDTPGYDPNTRAAYLFRTSAAGVLAERALLGVATDSCEEAGVAPYARSLPPTDSTELAIYNAIIADAPTTFGNTGFLAAASGHEIDKVHVAGSSGYILDGLDCGFPQITEVDTTPSGIIRLAEGTNSGGGADMIYYPHSGGGFVFSVGSINFGQSAAYDAVLKPLLERVLDLPLYLP